MSIDKSAEKSEKPTKFKVPKALGAAADLLFELRAKKAAAKRVVEEIEEQEGQVREYLINTLPKSESTGAVGKLAKAIIRTSPKPQVEDWDKFYAYIAKTKRWDLLQRRVGEKAVMDTWEAKKQIPGVKAITVVNVSVTKVG